MNIFETEDHSDIVLTLSNIASIQMNLNNLDEALKTSEKVLGYSCVYEYFWQEDFFILTLFIINI